MESLRRAPLVLVVAFGAWLVVVYAMRGMDDGPGTNLGAFGWFVGVWVAMMAAMMLPAASPAVSLVAGLRSVGDAWAFVAGYLVAWTVLGVLAYTLARGLRAVAPSWVAWDRRGPWLVGGALLLAGVYQLTPLKRACLKHCRSPLHFLMRARRGIGGAVAIGGAHGAYCIGCCVGLMLALFALGVMSLFWMAVVAAAVLVEKTFARGETAARVFAAALVALAVWVVVSPHSAPGVVQPSGQMMEMRP